MGLVEVMVVAVEATPRIEEAVEEGGAVEQAVLTGEDLAEEEVRTTNVVGEVDSHIVDPVIATMLAVLVIDILLQEMKDLTTWALRNLIDQYVYYNSLIFQLNLLVKYQM